MINKLNKNYSILAIFIIGISAIAFFLVYMPLRQIERSSRELFLNNNKDVILGLENVELENFKKNYDTYKPDLEKIPAMFVDPVDPVDFIKFLETTASASSITSDIIIVKPPAALQNTSTMIFSISAKGSFSGMVTFAERMETGPYLVAVQNLTMSRPEETSSKEKVGNQVQGTFLINVVTK